MELVPVKSSNIAGIGYDGSERAMQVEFTNGTRYEYADVSPEAHAAFMAAESIGSYFHKHVRGNYKHTRIADTEAKS